MPFTGKETSGAPEALLFCHKPCVAITMIVSA